MPNPRSRGPLPRLYPILDVDLAAERGLYPRSLLAAWLSAGVTLVQLRAKTMAGGALLELATALAAQAHAAGAALMLNDRPDVAVMAGADGVHLGQDDLAPRDLAPPMDALRVIGLSTHSTAQVRAGLDQPATYLAIGPVFATSSKAQPDPVVGLDGVRAAARLTSAAGRPLVAIGGITLDAAASVLEAGASSVAVISDLLTADPGGRAREYFLRLGASA